MDTILLHPNDNVKVVSQSKNARIPPGTKIAIADIAEGAPIIKFGVVIGSAGKSIAVGDRVDHTVMVEGENPLISKHISNQPDFPIVPERLAHFDGYLNENGEVGTRNYLCIITSVHCVSGIAGHAVARIREELLPRYPNVDGVVLLNHSYGCGVAIDANEAHIPRNTLSNLALNPNFGGYALFVGLGCEKLRHQMMLASLSDRSGPPRLAHDSLYFQSVEGRGFASIVSAICEKAEKALERLNTRKRQKVPISKLTIGMQCGGSDAFSGITANPVLGRMSDILIASGGATIFSENTECMDAEAYLMERCASEEVGKALKSEFDWYRAYLARSGVDRTANTTPGNKAGGLSTIVEKALGSIAKAGQSTIVDVIPAGERLRLKGLNYLSGPANDFICGTLQLAAGANIHVFTTGRGTPYSIDGFPVVKVSSNTELYQKWFDIIDFDAGDVARGRCLSASALTLLELLIKIASGERTAAECLGISNEIVLFNPAPIT
ncbi:UxaA family hydrolase [bacterium]|nr:UxaA family hydrolase [bacterium]